MYNVQRSSVGCQHACVCLCLCVCVCVCACVCLSIAQVPKFGCTGLGCWGLEVFV